jgi:hypothetical protein
MKRLLLTLTGVSAMMTVLFAQATVDLEVCAGKGYTLNSKADAVAASGEVNYQWYEDNVAMPGANASSLTVAAGKALGVYEYVRMAANEDCPTGVPSNTFTVRVKPIPTITLSSGDASQTVIHNTPITTIIYTASAAATISMSGDFPTGVTGAASGASFTISGTPTATGRFGYALIATAVNGCTTAAAGTITVVPTTLCTQCCYNGASWVDCHVTTNAYPFDNTSTNTTVMWSGNGTTFYADASGSGSDKNGRNNTANIPSSTVTVNAVQLCKDLGTDWYLPAYEELVNMSAGEANSALNNRAGADMLKTPKSWYWSSTEFWDNGGRCSNSSNTAMQYHVVAVHTDGGWTNGFKTNTAAIYVRCARRN